MKKFLAILLIAIIACSAVSVVEEEDLDLEKLKIKVPSWLQKAVKKALKEVKKRGIDKLILDALKKEGKKAGVKLCSRYFKEEVCEKVTDELLNQIK